MWAWHVCANVCVCAVRADAGGVRRPQRELDARHRARARRQRSTAAVHAQRLRHAGVGRDRTLPPLPYSGFLFFLFCLILFFDVDTSFNRHREINIIIYPNVSRKVTLKSFQAL